MPSLSEAQMENLSTKYDDLLWGVRRSIRYHSRRRMFFENFNLTANAIGLIFGSATILAVLTQAKQETDSIWWTVIPAALVTLFSSLNLVIGTVRKAQVHHDLVRRFTQLEQDMVKMDAPNEQMVREISAKRLQIEADEPPVKRIVDILCHNELMTATGRDQFSDPDHYYYVGRLQKLFSPICDLGADNIKTFSKHKSVTC